MSLHVPNAHRVRKGAYGSDDSIGNNGAFFLSNKAGRVRALSTRDATAVPLKIIASDGVMVPGDAAELAGWEHVSVSLPNRCPTWEEMAYVKSVFWDESDCVVQFHPPRSEYVNNHPFCLHLWRIVGKDFPMPPSILVGLTKETP
jgi:hypothetical protein